MKKETLEEAAENYGWRIKRNSFSDKVKANELAESAQKDFIAGAKWQQEKMYSEEDVKTAFLDGWQLRDGDLPFSKAMKKWFEQFKKK